MDNDVILSRLRDLAFTRGLNAGQLEQVVQTATAVQWDAGRTIFREGDRDSLLYLVEEGRIAIEIAVPGRGRVVILTVGPGEVFGWSSIFHNRPKTASARTIEPARVLALDAVRLRELCDTDPRLGYVLTRRILEIVAERLTATRLQLIDIYND
jgi:CRP-like cAMP-binding protein